MDRIRFLCALLACATLPASAEQLYAVDSSGAILLAFDSGRPSVLTSTAISGFASGGETIVGIDFRPATGGLYAVGRVGGATDTLRLYQLDPATGALTLVGAPITSITSGTQYGVDFNPTVDRLRVVNNADENLRINPTTGVRADSPTNDADLNPPGNLIDAVAYDRNMTGPVVANNTTLYAISRGLDSLVTIGGVNQSPSPNGGAVMNALPLGVTISAANGVGFEIFQNRAAYAAFTASATGLTGLYAIDLASGAATLVGLIGNGSVGVGGLTAAPSVEQVAAVDGAGTLFRFDTHHPDSTRGAVAVSGLAAGESIVGLDTRPATGGLYAVARTSGATDSLRLYRLDPITGVASAVGAAPVTGVTPGVAYGTDFNPVADRMRVVNSSDENLRINPDTDIAIFDIDLAPSLSIDAAAYDRNQSPPPSATTTLFAIARSGNQLAMIGGVDGSPSSPNGGAVTAIGALGVTIAAGGVGFDIVGAGTAYAGMTVGAETGLYTLNLGTGHATRVGPIGAGTAPIAAMAVLPSGTPLLRDGFE